MSMRSGYTVGRTTAESSLTDQLKRYKSREIHHDKKIKLAQKFANPAKESLVSKCIKVVVANFERNPVKEVIPPPQMAMFQQRKELTEICGWQNKSIFIMTASVSEGRNKQSQAGLKGTGQVPQPTL